LLAYHLSDLVSDLHTLKFVCPCICFLFVYIK
jgi:hypothetical protein